MERKRFLMLCQRVSIYSDRSVGVGCEEINACLVECDAIKYIPKAYILSYDKKGNAVHTAVLQDLKANSVTYAPLDSVQEVVGGK